MPNILKMSWSSLNIFNLKFYILFKNEIIYKITKLTSISGITGNVTLMALFPLDRTLRGILVYKFSEINWNQSSSCHTLYYVVNVMSYIYRHLVLELNIFMYLLSDLGKIQYVIHAKMCFSYLTLCHFMLRAKDNYFCNSYINNDFA